MNSTLSAAVLHLSLYLLSFSPSKSSMNILSSRAVETKRHPRTDAPIHKLARSFWMHKLCCLPMLLLYTAAIRLSSSNSRMATSPSKLTFLQHTSVLHKIPLIIWVCRKGVVRGVKRVRVLSLNLTEFGLMVDIPCFLLSFRVEQH